MKKLILIIGLLLSVQWLQASQVEKSITLQSGYNAIQFDANVTLEQLKEKIGADNLLMIQGAGQGSTYKKEYVDKGLEFLNSFIQTEPGKAFWFKVIDTVTFTYMAENFSGNKTVGLEEGWSFVGAMQALTLEEIKEQFGAGNLLVIQGAGQGQTYKKEYEGDLAFLNTFKKFEIGQGYWIKVANATSLNFLFELEKIAKDNTNHNVETVKNINGKSYTVRVYTDSTPSSETSQSTIAIYGDINGGKTVLYINNSYPTDARFQVKVFDENGEEVGRSDIVDYDSSAIEFNTFSIDIQNPCISLEDLKTKIANNEDVTRVNTGCIIDMSKLFYNNKTFNQDIGNWDVSHVTNMSYMFWGSDSFNQDIGSWDVSNVIDMSGMFGDYENSFNQPIGDWNVSSVINMSNMFGGAFNQALKKWDVSHVLNMKGMFVGNGHGSAFNQPIGDWNVSRVTNMSSMFRGKFNQPIGKWDVSSVRDMSYMFGAITSTSFNQPIGDWNVSNVTNMEGMFLNTPFNQPIGDWDVSNVTNMNSMFWFTGFNQDISKWNISNVTDMRAMLWAYSTENYDALLKSWSQLLLHDGVSLSVSDTKYSKEAEESRQYIIDTFGWTINDGGLDTTEQEVAQAKIESFAENSTNPKPTLQDYIDAGVVGVTEENLDAVNRTVDNATRDEVDTLEELNALVANPCITLEDLKTKIANDEDVTQVNTSCITDMSELFKDNKTFNQDISTWDVSNVTNMYAMFFSASSFNQPIGKWDVADVTNMSLMFAQATSFQQDIGDWNVSNVTDMGHMFINLYDFNQDLSKWNVSNVTNMSFMFDTARKFNSNIGDWNVSNVENMKSMFYQAENFNQDLSNWDVSKVIDYRSFADGSALQDRYNPFYEFIAPDYNVNLDLSQTHFTPGDTPVTVTIEVNELLGGVNSGALELSLTKNSHFNLTVENNSDWEVNSDDFDYKFKYIKDNGAYTPKAISTIRLTGIFHLEEGSRGSFPMTINFRSGSGDINSDNNSDSKQITYDSLQGTALSKIRAYADNNTNPVPTLQDYIDAGVVGVTADNLDTVNSAIDNATIEDIDTLVKLNALVESVISPEAGIEEKIVARHNLYRKLDFQDSDLIWDETLAEHAQQWADYIAEHYTVADRATVAPHASQFNTDTHGLPYLGEGENIAWASAGLKYVRDEAVDITVEDSAVENYEFGAVDMWANEKAYYDYATNSGNGEVVGHYTQVVWQKTTKVGCGKAKSTTDLGGDHIVCRYQIQGNMTGEKPYCSNYTVSDLYTETSTVFTNSIIEDASFVIEKVLEDRSACTRNDIEDSTLTFTGTTSALIPQYNTFNTSDGSNLWNMDFDNIQIDEDGQLIMTNTDNDRYMKLKIVGETPEYYSVEGYWWVIGAQYQRRAILKLMK